MLLSVFFRKSPAIYGRHIRRMAGVLLLCLLAPGPGRAQDSLLLVWQHAELHDTVRLKAIQKLIWKKMFNTPDTARLYAGEELAFARQRQLPLYEAKALYNIAAIHYQKGEFKQAYDFFQQSLHIRERLGDQMGQAAVLDALGLITRALGNQLKALDFHFKALEINSRLRDSTGIAGNLNNLANIYLEQKKYEAALDYYHQSLNCYDPERDKAQLPHLYNNIANVYSATGAFEQALAWFEKSIALNRAFDDRVGLSFNYTGLGKMFVAQGDRARAETYLRKSIELHRELGDQNGLAAAWHYMGELARDQSAFGDALRYCRRSLQMAREIGALSLQFDNCACLYETYKKINRPAEALFWHEQTQLLADSLNLEEARRELARLGWEKELLADSLKRAVQTQQMQEAHRRELTRKNQVVNIALGAGGLVLALSLLLWGRVLFFQKRATELQLRTEQLEKQHLISQIDLLRTQVNPHFLFNSLSILSSLVRVDPELSERFIDRLARSYRYILEHREEPLVPLRVELAFVQSYVFLLKIRFEHKFDVQIDLPDHFPETYAIAPLTLQLLLENAVKHNRMSVREPLVVHINATGDQLTVRNRMQRRNTPADSTGVGLQNIINRYALLTDRPVTAGAHGDHFIVNIPLIKLPDA
ncbi:MAG: tetratricopeptide repeat protein [Saprospiraceae bacterium]|nr:tetratricopeptide repeat protein [Saprospiraceae bacterium]